MPRSRRIALSGHPHLVIARGNNGGVVFADDSDFEAYLEKARDMVREDIFALHAFCLMRHELRLLIRPQRLHLARAVQSLHTAHARRMNSRHHRQGHLFEGRFRSVIVSEAGVDAATRAIHLWPVRVNRVRRPETYPWSSHRAYVSVRDEWEDILDMDALLNGFSPTRSVAKRSFARFVEQAALEPDGLGVVEVTPGIAGDRRFAEQVLAELGVEWRRRRRPALKTLSDRVSLLMNVSTDEIRSPSRLQALVVARRLLATTAVRQAGRSVTEVADFMHRDKAQVSRLVAQGMRLQKNDEAFRQLLEAVRGSRRPPVNS